MLGLGLSLLTGGSISPEYVKLSKAFVTRVEGDGGTVESFACLKTDVAYLSSNPNAPSGYFVEFSSSTVGSSASFIISGSNIIGYTYSYAITDSSANEVTGTGVIDADIDTITADLSTLVDGAVTVAVYLSGAGGDGLVVTDTATLVGYTGLLDTYSGAAAAYSLRLLDTSYTGNAIKVRRSSDNAEQDIAFVNNELDTASLETFAGSGDAFVTTWYDQSGSGNDATQTTASDQPKIVTSGSTILENGKAAVQFDGVDDGFTTSLAGSSIFNFYSVIRTNTGDDFILPDNYHFVGGYYGYIARSDTSTTIYNTYGTPSLYVNGALETPTTRSDVKNLLSTGNQLLNVHQGANTSVWSYIEMFGRQGFEFSGVSQEIIIWTTDQSSNRTGIETNINDFYSIY